MLSNEAKTFTKQNLDVYLKELAKEYRRLNGKGMKIELILIGGASIMLNYGFRDMTSDIDAIIHASSSIKDAINKVGDKYNLPKGWINSDFMKTASYSTKLFEFSKYYKTYSNIMEVRTISDEYLIAMKLKSGRKYKNDLSDVLGILMEHEKIDKPITLEQVNKAVKNLYGDISNIPDFSMKYIQELFDKQDYESMYREIVDDEMSSRDILIDFQDDYKDVLNASNVDDILEKLKERKM